MMRPRKAKRVLFVRHLAFGDVLFTTPFFRLLHEQDPDILIDLFSRIGEAYWNGPGFGHWISMFEIPSKRALRTGYSQVYWFYYEHDPSLHILDGYELSTGLKLKDRTLFWNIEPDERIRAQQRIKGMKRPIIGFSPACAHLLRSLPQRKIQQVIDHATERLGATFIVTHDTPLYLERCVNLTGRLSSMRELASIVAECDAWLAVDSGPLHLAQALAIPSVGLFGCTLPELRVTRPSHIRALRNESLRCLGCYHHVEPHSETLLECARGDLACMCDLDEAAITDSLRDVMAGHADAALLLRIVAYEVYREERMKTLDRMYIKAALRTYQTRIAELGKGLEDVGYFRRLERSIRHFRKDLLRKWQEQG